MNLFTENSFSDQKKVKCEMIFVIKFVYFNIRLKFIKKIEGSGFEELNFS